MKTEFSKRISDIIKEATAFLNSLAEGRIVHITTDKELEKDEDLLYNLPTASRVDKYSTYEEYGVFAVEKKDGKLLFHLQGRGEIDGKKIIDLSDGYYTISDVDMCQIVDEISEKLNS